VVNYNGQLVSVDARVPNKVVAAAISAGQLADFSQFTVARSEVRYGNSRLDLLLEDQRSNRCFVEVKSVTLVENGTAMFPDAPTQRGARHLEELTAAVREGYQAAIIFLIQRGDAILFTPNDRTDPDFGQKLRAAAGNGVGVYAYRCRVTPEMIVITEKVPVKLSGI
jgi:sugar fermentation stimulation protein A